MDKPWKVALAFIGVFTAGAVFGGFFSVGIGKHMIASLPPPPLQKEPKRERPLLEMPPVWRSAQLLGRFTERLDLTDEQRERIKPLVQRATEDYRRQQNNNLRETGFILDRLQKDIRKELVPEQLKKLEKMEEHQRETMDARKEQRALEPAPARGGPGSRAGGRRGGDGLEP